MSWVNDPWLGFDTETTGINTSEDRLVTAATILRLHSEGASTDHVHTWLADPGVPIPAAATAVHGISTAYAQAHGSPSVEIVDEVAATLAEHWRRGFPVVAFNAPFDISLLCSELKRHRLPSLSQRCAGARMLVIDPLVLDRHLVEKRRGKRTLGDLAPAYGVELSENAHSADADVMMTLDVLRAMVSHFPELAQMSLPDLHDAQAAWHAQWAEDFESFLHSRGRMQTISRSWL